MSSPILFDYAAYETSASPIDAATWFRQQTRAGADRLLTPGRWLDWWGGDAGALADAVAKEAHEAHDVEDATIVLALDYRWLTKGLYALLDTLADLKRPLAIVLSHRGDPLSCQGAVNGLIAVTARIPNVTVLRCDHGAGPATDQSSSSHWLFHSRSAASAARFASEGGRAVAGIDPFPIACGIGTVVPGTWTPG